MFKNIFKKIIIFSFSLGLITTPGLLLASSVNLTDTTNLNTNTIETPNPVCPIFNRSLYIGIHGNDVLSLQKYLNEHGFALDTNRAGSPGNETTYFGSLTQKAVANWQEKGGVVSLGGYGSGTFGPLSRAYFAHTCKSNEGSDTKEKDIQQINTPESVTLFPRNIAEVRNESFYFTLKNLTSKNATIEVTPVGCWNSFPSDPTPKMHCMIAVMPIPPVILTAGDIYLSGKYNITLTKISDHSATFFIQ